MIVTFEFAHERLPQVVSCDSYGFYPHAEFTFIKCFHGDESIFGVNIAYLSSYEVDTND